MLKCPGFLPSENLSACLLPLPLPATHLHGALSVTAWAIGPCVSLLETVVLCLLCDSSSPTPILKDSQHFCLWARPSMTGQSPAASHACWCPGQQSVPTRPPFARVSSLHLPPPPPACGDPCTSGSLSISLKEKKEKDSSMLFFSKGKKKGKKKQCQQPSVREQPNSNKACVRDGGR